MSRIRTSVVSAALLAVFAPSAAWADPPVPNPFVEPIPPVFCTRITSIRDIGPNEFEFELEVIHWGNSPVGGLTIALNNAVLRAPGGGPNDPSFSSAGVDPDGRPLLAGSDDANFAAVPPPPGAPFGGKTGLTNNFELISFGPDFVRWLDAVPPFSRIPGRDLIGAAPAGGPRPCSLIPTCAADVVGNVEAIDNGGPTTDGGVDNALDGFVFRIRDFEPGDGISLDWVDTDENANNLGTTFMGNQFSYGTLNLFRGATGPALVQRLPNSPQGAGTNTGASTNLRHMFQSVSSPSGSIFSAELGVALSVPLRNPQLNDFVNLPPNGQAIPVTPALPAPAMVGVALGLALAGTVYLSRQRRRRRV